MVNLANDKMGSIEEQEFSTGGEGGKYCAAVEHVLESGERLNLKSWRQLCPLQSFALMMDGAGGSPRVSIAATIVEKGLIPRKPSESSHDGWRGKQSAGVHRGDHYGDGPGRAYMDWRGLEPGEGLEWHEMATEIARASECEEEQDGLADVRIGGVETGCAVLCCKELR